MRNKKHEPESTNTQTAVDIDEAIAHGDNGQSGVQDEASDIRATLAQCQQELQEAKNALLRAHADFDNFRKRMRAERDKEYTRGTDKVFCDLLPIVDDFERALASVNGKTTVESLQQGVDLIYRQLLNLLERYGITAMSVEGEPFDPRYHDAIARVCTTEQREHTIIAETQRGYLKNGEVFRPAKVAVAVEPDETH